MARILLTDGDQRSALAVIRSLGRAGHFVVAGDCRESNLAGASRFAAARAALPDPLVAPGDFATAAGEAARLHGCEWVVPVTDASALALLSRPDVVAPARIPMPPVEAYGRASDKARVAEEAAAVGIRVPRQVLAATREEAATLASAAALRPPLVLKPARSVAGGEGGRLKQGVRHASDWSAVARLAPELPEGSFPLLIQERVLGTGTGIFVLVWDKRLVAAFAHRRLREKPPAGGVSVLCESAPLDPDLLARSVSLLDRLGWYGVAMIEYKREAASGDPFLMEINARFWGSLQLAIDSGVDFPRLLIECAEGGSPEPVTSFRVGVRNRWWWGDFDHLLTRFSHSDAALHLPAGFPGRLNALAAFVVTGFMGAKGQVFQAGDSGPARREARDRVREFLRL